MQNNLTTKLIKAGFLPLPVWLILVTIAGFIAVDYNPIASHASVMTLQEGNAHLLLNIAAITIGLSFIVFAIGIWALSKRKFSAGAFCWVLFGISMIANGIWPMGGPMHGLYIIGIANIIAPALSLLDIQDDTLRNELYSVTVFVSICSLFYMWILLNGFDPEGYTGLTQRIFASITYLWPMVFTIKYLKIKKL